MCEKKEKIILLGAGQHARVVLYNMEEQGRYEAVGIIDENVKKIGTKFEGINIVGTDRDSERIKEKYKTNKFFVGFGDPIIRQKVFKQYISKGWQAVNIIHTNAVVAKNAQIGSGVLIECGCLITPNPIIGDNVVINTGSQVNHDNIIGNDVYIASGVVLSGGVTIGQNTLIDDGVIVAMGQKIGKNCIIGAGSVVTKEIPDNVVAYGNPCRIIRER